MAEPNNWPKLHNAMWPGVVGKGGDAEPPIDLKTLIDLTAGAKVDGEKFDGVDLFLAEPHTSIDSSDDQIKSLADKVGVARASQSARLSRRFGRRLAAVPRWATRGARTLRHDGREGLPHRQETARSRRPALWRRAHRFGDRRA